MMTLYQVAAEGLPQMFRCAVVVTGILVSPEWGLRIFCVGQVRLYHNNVILMLNIVIIP